jgi:alkylhydroperoxidase family enzyme
MARVSAAAPEQFAQVADIMERWRETKGYPPNSWLTMLRRPAVFRAYRALHTAVMMDEGELPRELKFMVAHAVSDACGDPYTAAHNAENAAHIAGVPARKVEALARFDESPLFDPAERAALRLARAAGACPPCVTDAHFTELRRHYGENAIVEIVSVIALAGWLNRWNMTLATPLEERAADFARRHLAPSGWAPGAHGPGGQA